MPPAKETPAGRVPAARLIAGVGSPLAPAVNRPAPPVVNVVEVPEVNAGTVPGLVTVRVRVCGALPSLLVALSLSWYCCEEAGGAAALVGMPAIVAVPSPLSV